jgi:hypothetical protein
MIQSEILKFIKGRFGAYSLVICSFLLLFSQPLKAQEAAIVDLVVANSKTDLLAFFSIEDAFSPELIKGVKHGIPVTFAFEVVLEMKRNGWPDKTIVNGSFEHTLTYDNLKKVYSVRLNEHREEVMITDDLSKAQRYMCEANGIHIAPLTDMLPDHHYTLRVKATLEKTTLPLKFHYLIPFSEFWDLKTDWTEVEFLY